MEVYRPKGSRVYYYDVTLPGQPRVRRSTGLTNYTLARLKAQDEVAKARDNGSVDVLLHKAPVLEIFAAEFIVWVDATQTLKLNTKKFYKNGWAWLKDTPVAKMQMDKIRNHDLEVIQFPGDKPEGTANCSIGTLRKMYSKAEEMGKFFGKRPKFKARKCTGRSVHMTPADAIDIDANWNPGKGSQNSREIFRVISSSGFRPEESFRARWEYMVWDKGVYCNRDGKTEAARREVPLSLPPFDCLQILRDRWERMGRPSEGWVFPTTRGSKSGHLVSIQIPFTQARNRAGKSRAMVLYTARHGVCTRVAEVTTLKGVMQSMGHSDVRTAMKYQHPDTKQIGEKLWEKMKTQKDAKFLAKVGVRSD